MKKRMCILSKGTALMLAVMLCAGCGQSAEETVETTPAAVQPTATEAPATPTEVPATLTPTPSPVPTQVPLKDLEFVRPSYANVTSAAKSYADERGSFVTTNKNTLSVLLPTDDASGYTWHCADNYEDGVFTVSEASVQQIPFTYTSGKYGGVETPKSEIQAAEEAYRNSQREAAAAEAASDNVSSDNPDTGTGTETETETGDAGEDVIIEEIIIYEEVPEEYYEEEIPIYDDESQSEEVIVDDSLYEEYAAEDAENVVGGNIPVSFKAAYARSSAGVKGCSSGIKAMSVSEETGVTEELPVAEETPAVEEMTYVYAPSRTEFVFTPQSAGTDIFYLECTKGEGTASVLDNGFILFAHADENLEITFDLVWYSFADCVAAPEKFSEADASIITEEVAAQEAAAAEAFDSCLRNDNTIGAASRMVDESYWEVYPVDNSVADITSNGGAFYHEDFVDYSWDMFSVNPLKPGRTTVYFIHVTGDNTTVPRTQVADIHVADDLSVTAHVRRLDMGVQFD